MSQPKLAACVQETLDQYFRDLGGTQAHGLHAMIMLAVEKPLLEAVLAQAEGNQSLAATWLGINRNTLKRKLVEHGLSS